MHYRILFQPPKIEVAEWFYPLTRRIKAEPWTLTALHRSKWNPAESTFTKDPHGLIEHADPDFTGTRR